MSKVSHSWHPQPHLPLARDDRMSVMEIVRWLSAWLLPVVLRFIVSSTQGTYWENIHPLYVLMGSTDENSPSHRLITGRRECTQKRAQKCTEDIRELNVRVLILFSSPFYCLICGGSHPTQVRQLNYISNLLGFAWCISYSLGLCSVRCRAPLSAGYWHCVLKIVECFIDFIIILCVWLVCFIAMCKIILCSLKCNKTELYMILWE